MRLAFCMSDSPTWAEYVDAPTIDEAFVELADREFGRYADVKFITDLDTGLVVWTAGETPQVGDMCFPEDCHRVWAASEPEGHTYEVWTVGSDKYPNFEDICGDGKLWNSKSDITYTGWVHGKPMTGYPRFKQRSY